MRALLLTAVVWAAAAAAAAQDPDGDAIADGADRCPSETETYDGTEDDDGCPEAGARLLVRVAEGEIELLEPPVFDFDDAEIRPGSFPLLEALAALLRARPELGPVTIEGHMSRETWAEVAHMSRRLWLDRAQAVMAFLISRGVPTERLDATSLVTDRPRCDPSSVPRRRRRACWRRNDRIVVRLTPP
jgi:OmpA-OmpF porin, OOP family